MEMKYNKSINGYTFYYKGKDMFVVTDKRIKTKKLIREILEKINYPVSNETVSQLSALLFKAKLELKNCSRGDYYEIYGNNFGGCGSFVNDGKTVVIELNK